MRCENCWCFDGYDVVRTNLAECTLYGLTTIDESKECLNYREKTELNLFNQILNSADNALNEYHLSKTKVITE